VHEVVYEGDAVPARLRIEHEFAAGRRYTLVETEAGWQLAEPSRRRAGPVPSLPSAVLPTAAFLDA